MSNSRAMHCKLGLKAQSLTVLQSKSLAVCSTGLLLD